MLYDGGADDWTPEDVHAVLGCVVATRRALEDAGHDVDQIAVDQGFTWLAQTRKADAVFNLCEGIGGISSLESKVASAVELLGIPMTGGSAWTMTICHRKPILNAVLAARGLPVPQWSIPSDDDELGDFPLPAIVKPAAEDASVGVDQDAVLMNHADLRDRVEWCRAKFGSVIVQRYIEGRELAVAFVGDDTLPLSEIDFSGMPQDHWPIVTFDAKWTPGSADFKGTVPKCPADVAQGVAESTIEVATLAWQVVEGRGYGRIDMRVDADGKPWIIEVNPNPDTSPDAGLENMARAHGWSYETLVERILEAAFVPALASSRAGALR